MAIKGNITVNGYCYNDVYAKLIGFKLDRIDDETGAKSITLEIWASKEDYEAKLNSKIVTEMIFTNLTDEEYDAYFEAEYLAINGRNIFSDAEKA